MADENPLAVARRLLMGFRATHLLYVMAELGVADRLADGPRGSAALVADLGAHPDALHRVLRALARPEDHRARLPRRRLPGHRASPPSVTGTGPCPTRRAFRGMGPQAARARKARPAGAAAAPTPRLGSWERSGSAAPKGGGP